MISEMRRLRFTNRAGKVNPYLIGNDEEKSCLKMVSRASTRSYFRFMIWSSKIFLK